MLGSLCLVIVFVAGLGLVQTIVDYVRDRSHVGLGILGYVIVGPMFLSTTIGFGYLGAILPKPRGGGSDPNDPSG